MSIPDIRQVLVESKMDFAPVVPFDPAKDQLMQLDFTAANIDLTKEIFNDTKTFTEYVSDKLLGAGCRYGIGGYNELRTVYSRSRLFDGTAPNDSGEPRRLHLGIDIWGKPNAAVMAPLDGIIHSFAFNDRKGDYGATIILTHQLKGIVFYTLYGHLSMNSIKNINEGDRIMKGDIFADFGLPHENGQWPPHLHFQVIRDLQGWSGDYPGVCKYSEREKYLINCPNADLILQLNQYISI